MEVKLTGLVKDIKDWKTNKEGKALPPEDVKSQITFYDPDYGGDVVMTFPAGHGYKVGRNFVEVNVVVKPIVVNYKLSLYVLGPVLSSDPLPPKKS